LEAVPPAAHTEWIRLSIGGREMTTARSLAEVIHIERGFVPLHQESWHLDRIFQAAWWCSALENKGRCSDVILGKRGIPAKQEALLISDWRRQCPRLMVQMKPVTQSADGGEVAIPYCWSWPLDFLFLAPPRAHCIMRCGR
jgi:hypothetical protein